MVRNSMCRVGTLLLAWALVACGGEESASTTAAESSKYGDVTMQAVSSWAPVAAEWRSFSLAAPATVRYGAGSTWVERSLPAGTHQCSNAVFGDPLPGIQKQCEVGTEGTSSSGSWAFVANEWGAFDMAAAGRVRYGTDAGWVERDVPAGRVSCTNGYFGTDPVPGTAKRCEVLQGGSSSSGDWSWLADEWGTFSLGATTVVRYGAGTAWVERSLPAGSFGCNNGAFGTDPLPGTVKHCERNGGSVTNNTSPPPPTTPNGTGALDRPANRAEAMRFLTQATFGPTEADIERVTAIGYSAWIDEQFARGASSHRSAWRSIDQVFVGHGSGDSIRQMGVTNAFWRVVMSGNDQLRQRVAFALSQIMVISMREGTVGMNAEAVSAYLDMLGDKGLGTYRDLLQGVATHPLMGTYLSHLKNQKADASGRVPDENFAREIMQLFSIGLHELNADGTVRTSGGVPIETYTANDIAGLAKVFTGWAWNCSDRSNWCYEVGTSPGTYGSADWYSPMVNYAQYLSEDAKSFLGVTIPARSPGNGQADLTVALDTLANHPNVGPFIGKQLIQRLVTSNPSAGYVADVARVFANNGSGQRGDMRAVIKAILMHPEARTTSGTSGKVREPILRLTAVVRALGMTSRSGYYWIGNTEDAGLHLGQSPMNAPSVFNFFRPGYVAPGSSSAAKGLVGPEMQILHETSAAGYVNYMRDLIDWGVGWDPYAYRADLVVDLEPFKAVADQPSTLVDRVAAKLLYTSMPDEVRQDIVAAITSIAIPAPGQDPWWINSRKESRVKAALLFTVASPEFQVQR